MKSPERIATLEQSYKHLKEVSEETRDCLVNHVSDFNDFRLEIVGELREMRGERKFFMGLIAFVSSSVTLAFGKIATKLWS